MLEESSRQDILKYLHAGRLDTARQLCVQQLESNSHDPEAWLVLAAVHAQSGAIAEVESCCRRAVELRPGHVMAHYNLARALQELGRTDESIEHYRAVLRLQPDYTQACINLSVLYRELQLLNDAEVLANRAVQIDPQRAETHNNLGVVLKDLGRLDDAQQCFERALSLDAGFVEARHNLGLNFMRRRDYHQAIRCFEAALATRPQYADAYSDLGAAHQAQGNYELAMSHYQHAIDINPQDAYARWNRALLLLLLGNYTEGWNEYEWRWRSQGRMPRQFKEPEWEGSPLAGRPILLHAEQGFGDTLQFIRYATVIAQLGGRVIVECQAELLELLKTCPGIDTLVERGQPLPEFAVQLPLLSAPRLLWERVKYAAPLSPYLHAPGHGRQALLQALESRRNGLRIGVSWAGNPQHSNDHNRSCPPHWFTGLAALPDIHWFSLQKGSGSASELARHLGNAPVTDLGPLLNDFVDTAHAIMQLDIIITVDTSVAHLAGALGQPTWVLLPFVPDWRWLLRRTDCPWYPSMRLFRQPSPGNWGSVIDALAQTLRDATAV